MEWGEGVKIRTAVIAQSIKYNLKKQMETESWIQRILTVARWKGDVGEWVKR